MNNNNNNNNKNDNDANLFVNLSHLLLTKITDRLRDNIDRICLSLVCKRLYNERNKYLTFNTRFINSIHKDNTKEIYLNSYKSILINSFNQKTNCTLLYDKQMNIDKIDSNVIQVDYDSDFSGKLEVNQSISEKLYQLIANSNVVKLVACQTLRYQLPSNLISLEFDPQFNEPLEPGFLPPNLRKLRFGFKFNQIIKHGILPNKLEKLTLGQVYNQPLEPGVLPTSLKVLKMTGTSWFDKQDLKVGSLPPALEVFRYTGHSSEFIEGILPTTVHTFMGVPFSWITSPLFKSYCNLKSLTVRHSPSNHQSILDLQVIPASVTKLIIFDDIHLKSTMPPTIKYLDITCAQYDIDEIFNDRSIYHFETLKIGGFILDSLENIKVDHLHLAFRDEYEGQELLRDIPNAIKVLSFDYCMAEILIQSEIPASVKVVKIENNTKYNRFDFIPNTLESLVIRDDIGTSFCSLPELVNPLTIPTTDILIPRDLSNICFKQINDRIFRRFQLKGNKNFTVLVETSVRMRNNITKSKSIAYNKLFGLNSYNYQIDSARECKSNCSLYISTLDDDLINQSYEYDYYLNHKSIGKEILRFPETIVRIYFSNDFNQCIAHYKSLFENSNVKELHFGKHFNVAIQPGSLLNVETIIRADVLPPSLEYLSFGDCFHETLEVPLPPDLRVLKFGKFYEETVRDDVLPQGLLKVRNFPYPSRALLPSSTKTISFSQLSDTPFEPQPGDLSSNFTSIDIKNISRYLMPGALPQSTVKLKLGQYFNQNITVDLIPRSVEKLYLGESFNVSIKPNVLPKSLKELIFSPFFNRTLQPKSIPESVESITFNGFYSCSIKADILPASVRHLTFKADNCLLQKPGIIPTTVKSMELNNQRIKEGVIPLSVETLTISIEFFKFNKLKIIPLTINTIILKLEEDVRFNLKRIGQTSFIIMSDHSSSGAFISDSFFENFEKMKSILNLYKLKSI
ncbi:hypothetical protein PPL_10047 [Heterostelium album PN500]|uniref:FNIP repeat-containing protein n=1 Tax=Heterostelium pallidum (strain ATCC 26659 / Pp 5 / PN500) TaxID=670386 RepID=D3BQ65_HETP5|nr:hypothetical protein PPL_10047 [Heterostelium album PN500]EFA76285.1 hypothetical protein PPL_10047 [Heterostelium album PN500]|eukprot:XP_020428417.1 hypothetical protein PPL_10047 [Heterostelium album PN500]